MQGKFFSRNDEVITLVSANHYQPLRAPKFNIRVLLAPLDWGLGHATRCIPIVQRLLAKGCIVVIATQGAQQQLLQKEFPVGMPGIEYTDLKGYGVRYAKRFLLFRLLLQLPAIQKAIQKEQKWLAHCVESLQIDWVISDNRYGLFSNKVPCTIMTHQLQVQAPKGFKSGEPWVQAKLYHYINKFSACWVPDLPDEQRGLSGALGHPSNKPAVPVWYVGWLSRFKTAEETQQYQYKSIILLSGPEPQRSLLEEKIVQQLSFTIEKMMLVRGLPAESNTLKLPPHIEVHNHLEASLLQQAIINSEFLVGRCGYSTLMDAYTLQKKCIFIPTPGQTEQEYLAKRLAHQQMAVVVNQEKFDLGHALEKASRFHFHFPLNSMNNLLDMAIDYFLQTYFADKRTTDP